MIEICNFRMSIPDLDLNFVMHTLEYTALCLLLILNLYIFLAKLS